MGSPSPVPGSARRARGSPRWNRSKTSSRSAAGTPGPSSTTSRTTSLPTTADPQLDAGPRRGRRALSSRFRTTRRSSPALARTGPADTRVVSTTVSVGVPRPRRLLEHDRVEVDRASARRVRPRRPRRGPAGRRRAAPSRPSRRAPRRAAPRRRRRRAGAGPAPTRPVGRRAGPAGRGRRRRPGAAVAAPRPRPGRASRFMVAASRPTSSRRPSSAILRSSWSWPMRVDLRADPVEPRQGAAEDQPDHEGERRPAPAVHRPAGSAAERAVASCTASRLRADDDGHPAVGRLAGAGPRPGRSRSPGRRALDGAPLDRSAGPGSTIARLALRCWARRPGRCRPQRSPAPRRRRSRCGAPVAGLPARGLVEQVARPATGRQSSLLAVRCRSSVRDQRGRAADARAPPRTGAVAITVARARTRQRRHRQASATSR